MEKNKKGFLIWVTGLSGSGKSLLAIKIKKNLKKKNINSILVNGDDLRKIFNLNKFDKKSRLRYAKSYSMFCKQITDQGTNVIIATIAMFEDVRKWNRKNIKNYYEIYLKTSYKLIKKRNKKKLYLSKINNVIGKDIKPELPKKPDFIFKNNFKNNSQLNAKLFLKIDQFIKKKYR